ncbi:MAG: ABC transporter ATP-binding protein [Firmicutes bacterium]|nr:ABC transporter ATP-binding protein [Bacillota bacterium]
MAIPAYEVRDLVKRYRPDGPLANAGITLEIRAGEVFGLLGPNGAGKTTLVRQLAGLSRPTSGAIRLFGHDLTRDPLMANRYVAVQPQAVALPGQARPGEVLELTGRLRRLASIAATLIGRRPVLIFDEPTNDLDPEVRRRVWQRIRDAAREGATVVLVTHNVVEAEQALDRVAIFRAGRVLALGTPGELKARVARQVWLELCFRPGTEEPARAFLAAWPAARRAGAHRYTLVQPADEAEVAVRYLLGWLDHLDDFQIVTPNLEDVYLELSGGERLES